MPLWFLSCHNRSRWKIASFESIFPSAFPRTARRMEARGLRVVTVDADELAKAEGAVTCCSLIIGE